MAGFHKKVIFLNTFQLWRLFLTALTCTAFCFQGNAASRQYIVAAATNRTNLDLREIECVSVSERAASIFGKSYSMDRRVDTLIQKSLLNDSARPAAGCQFAFLFNIVAYETKAVKYLGKKSKVLMSFDVCKQDSTGRIEGRPCSSKNLYLFEGGLDPIVAFEIGLKAFLRRQESEWTIMAIELEERR